MSEPYLGEIRLFPYSRGAPINWHLCDGSLLAISEHDTLYALIGTTYGGDGQTNFALPDMRGSIPIHQGTGPGLSTYLLGQRGGTEEVTLLATQMPGHGHNLLASDMEGTSASPANGVTAMLANDPFYGQANDGSTPYPLPASTISPVGGNLPHENCAPTLALNYCISLWGVYPTQD